MEVKCTIILDENPRLTFKELPGFHFPVELDVERLTHMLENDAIEPQEEAIMRQLRRRIDGLTKNQSVRSLAQRESSEEISNGIADALLTMAWWVALWEVRKGCKYM